MAVPSFDTARQFYDYLDAAVADRGAVALRRMAELAVEERELSIKGPCIGVMALWDHAGLQAITEIATKHPGSKNISQALRVLSTIASARPMHALTAFMHDDTLLQRINSHLADGHLVDEARHALRSMVMTLPTEELLIPLGTAFTQIALGDPAIATEVVAAISAKWLKFGRAELEAFEALLQSSGDDEPALHAFLERNPQMLDPMAVQVWSKPDFHGAREPDFLIRRSDNTYVVVEIEKATKALMTQGDQPASSVTQAVQQVNDYRAFLEERIQEARAHFPAIHPSMEALVVIGMEGPLTSEQARALGRENQSRSRTKIVGFDWLLARAWAVFNNVTDSRVDVVKSYRVI